MLPASIDFLLRTNADYGEELSFVDGETPIDLTSLTFKMQVRKYPGGPLLFTVPIPMGDAENGIVALNIARETIAQAYAASSGVEIGETVQASHDIVVHHVDGFREVWCQGRVTIQQGVTENV